VSADTSKLVRQCAAGDTFRAAAVHTLFLSECSIEDARHTDMSNSRQGKIKKQRDNRESRHFQTLTTDALLPRASSRRLRFSSSHEEEDKIREDARADSMPAARLFPQRRNTAPTRQTRPAPLSADIDVGTIVLRERAPRCRARRRDVIIPAARETNA
jgi:hypothetical protein